MTTTSTRRKEVEGLNPAVLRWARERSGRSIEEVAGKLGKDPAVVGAWEAGQGAPTYVELERLAYDVLKRPLAMFFFPAPPEEPALQEAFRTLPGFEVEKLTPETRNAVRRARADQLGLAELFNGRSPAARSLVRDVRVSPQGDVVQAAAAVRQVLGVSIAQQTNVWKTEREALEGWRGALEESGVFVFKDGIRQRWISGFCLYDPVFPLVVLNNSASLTRQIFTLMHEVWHLLSHTSGVTVVEDAEYLRALRGESRAIEIFCKRFAAEVLVPVGDFKERTAALDPGDGTVQQLAHLYKVSREVVFRRFLDLGRVSNARYEEEAKEWTSDFERDGKSGGGDFNRTHVSYLSPKLLMEVMGRYLRGSLDAVEAAGFLGVTPSHMAGLEEAVLTKIGARGGQGPATAQAGRCT